MKKLLIVILALIALLLVTLISGWWWVTTSRGGAEWALNQTVRFVPSLRWQTLEGDFRNGVVLTDLRLEEGGTEIAIGRVELAVRVRLPPGAAVDVDWLRIRDADILLPEPTEDEIDRPPFEIPDLSSPVPIRLSELLVDQARIRFRDEAMEAIVVDQIRMAGAYHDQITIDQLRIESELANVSGQGQWQLSEPFNGRMVVDADVAIDEQTRQQLALTLSGRMAALDLEFTAEGPARVQGRGRLRGLPEMPEISLRMDGELADWPDLPYAVRDLNLQVDGRVDRWEAELAGRVEGPEVPDNRLRGSLRGTTESAVVDQLVVDVFEGQVRLSGEGSWAPALAADAQVELVDLDLTSLYADWPEQAPISGRVDITASEQLLEFDNLELRAPPTSLRVTGSGAYQPESDVLALNLQWADLAWPPVTDDSEPLLESETGSLRLTGTLSAWQLELEAVLRAAGMPASEVQARASGNESSADLGQLDVQLAGSGQLGVQGQVQWSPEVRGQLQVHLMDFDPGEFAEQFPGQINARLSLDLRSASSIALQIDELSGQLRGQELAGSGAVRISDEQPEAGNMTLSLGDNRLLVDSDDGQLWRWRLQAGNLAHLWPELSGQAELDGTLEPEPGRVEAGGQATSITYGDISLEQAELTLDMVWKDLARVDMQLKLVDLGLNPWERLDHVEFSVTGDCQRHDFSLDLAGLRGSLDLNGQGALDGCLADTQGWRGSLDRLYLGNTLAGDWELNQPLAIAADADLISAGPACLVESATRQGRLCLDSLVIDGDSHLDLRIAQVPMDLLLLPLDPMFNLTTPLSGELHARWHPNDGLTELVGFLALGSGALRPLGGDQDLLLVESVRLDFAPDNGELLLSLQAVLEGDSRLRGEARVLDLSDPGSAEIDADATLNLPDIGVFNRLVSELDQLEGRLAGTLTASGPVRSPSIQGQLSLSDGVMAHAPLGLKVEGFNLELQGENDALKVRGQMRSGEGHLALDGELSQQNSQWVVVLNVDGERFSVADVDWLRLEASPKIGIRHDADGLHIDGDILIDRLRAGLPPGTEDRVGVSSDVRIVGETDDEAEETPMRIRGRLGIDIGRDARLAAAGMQTDLAGDLELLWDGSGTQPIGRGAILLPDGSYRAYGQNLEISDGEIFFTGHSLDNPRLDIKAVRDIFGDPQVEEAGVRILGNARNPTVSLFTDPPTSEEKALAYIVTGADFDHAGGQAAVNVGFYVLPRLFVSYGIGLFEAGNVLSGRYELSRRWGVRIVSGERDTGVDLSFAIDR